MSSVLPAQCFACTRWHDRRTPTDAPIAVTCDAFPAGIPRAMQLGGDHRSPLPDDNGLQFVQADSDRARLAFEIWQRTAITA